eukprot:COSAG03_NODE_329_length_8941_cov_54.617620_5_plen_168_part_00
MLVLSCRLHVCLRLRRGMWRAQDLSVNTNWDVGHSDGTPNFQAGLPYQLPTPSGEGPSPWKGGLPNVAVTMQKGGYATAHYGKWRKSRQPLVARTPAAIYSAHCRSTVVCNGAATRCTYAVRPRRFGRMLAERYAHAVPIRVWLRSHRHLRISRVRALLRYPCDCQG